MSRASWRINEIDNKLLIVSAWLSKKEGALLSVISPDELQAQNRELEACESLVRQLQTQVQLYGLDDQEVNTLAYVAGTANDLRLRLQAVARGTPTSFFEHPLNVASAITSGISSIMNRLS